MKEGPLHILPEGMEIIDLKWIGNCLSLDLAREINRRQNSLAIPRRVSQTQQLRREDT